MKRLCTAARSAALFAVLVGCNPPPGTNLPTKGQPPPPPGAMDKSTYKPGKEDKTSKGGKITLPPAGKP